MSWVVIAVSYLAMGALFVFVGPAAAALSRERMTLYAPEEWKEWVFLFAMATGIVLLWPVLVPSAHRSNDRYSNRKPYVLVLSEAGRLRIEETRRHDPRMLSIAEYERIGDDLEFDDAPLLRREMDRLGYTVDAATTDTGERIPVSMKAFSEIGSPITLSQPTNEGIGGPSKNGLWHFTNGEDDWEHLAGRAGQAWVKDGVVVKLIVTAMS